MWVWVKIKPPGIGPQVLVHVCIYQGVFFGVPIFDPQPCSLVGDPKGSMCGWFLLLVEQKKRPPPPPYSRLLVEQNRTAPRADSPFPGLLKGGQANPCSSQKWGIWGFRDFWSPRDTPAVALDVVFPPSQLLQGEPGIYGLRPFPGRAHGLSLAKSILAKKL